MANVDLILTFSSEAAQRSLASLGALGLDGSNIDLCRCLARFPDIFVFDCDLMPVIRPSASQRLFGFDLKWSGTDGLCLSLTPLPRWTDLVEALAVLMQRGIEMVDGWAVIMPPCAVESPDPSSRIVPGFTPAAGTGLDIDLPGHLAPEWGKP